jgi:cell division protease FtsH
MGGRVAEEIVFNEISTGAADDLQKATEIARAMITEYGMSKKLGPLAFGSNGRSNGFFSEGPHIAEETQLVIDQEAGQLMNEARDRAIEILKRDRDLLEKLSRVLVAREVLEGDELMRYVEDASQIPSDEEIDREAAERAQRALEEADRRDREHAELSGPDIVTGIGTAQGDGLDLPRFPSPVPGGDIPPRPD